MVADEINGCLGLAKMMLRQFVHPDRVGREKYVSRYAILDLLGERRARPVNEQHLATAIFLGNGVQRGFKRDRGQDANGVRRAW
jgi:hypothetical protein